MRPLRLAAALLAALAVAVVPAPPAAAATNTWADHDGTAEAAVRIDSASDGDFALKDFVALDGMLSATTATVRLYARAGGCSGSGATQRLYTQAANLVASFDPCATFPTTGYGWADFAVPLSSLTERRPAFRVVHVGAAGQRYAHYAMDTGTDVGRTYALEDGGSELPGELMWELVFDGSTPAVAARPKTVDYGLVPPSTGAARTVTVTSTGTATATISGVALSGSADYAVTADGCTGASLAPQATCAVTVTLTPSGLGPRTATLTVSGNVTSRTVSLTGQGRSQPPATVVTSPADGAVVPAAFTVSGTVTDDFGVAEELVTFTPASPALTTVTKRMVLACDAARTACSWSSDEIVLVPGPYTLTARATDVQGIAETGVTVQILVV